MWAGALIASTDPLHFELKFGAPSLLGSGAIPFQSYNSDTAMIGQKYVLSDTVSCFLPEAPLSDLSSLLESPLPCCCYAKLAPSYLL